MDERNALNDKKYGIAMDTTEALSDLFVRIFNWQMNVRGCSSRAAYACTAQELEHLLESVEGSVKNALQHAYGERR